MSIAPAPSSRGKYRNTFVVRVLTTVNARTLREGLEPSPANHGGDEPSSDDGRDETPDHDREHEACRGRVARYAFSQCGRK